MESDTTSWKKYEAAARRVIYDLRRELGVSEVQDKQSLRGASGVVWEIDGIAIPQGESGILVIEARRHTTSGQKQEDLAALAYRINDLAASGGFIVSPLPLQKGAAMLAWRENVIHIELSPDSDAENYFAKFLERVVIGATLKSSFVISDTVTATVTRKKPANDT